MKIPKHRTLPAALLLSLAISSSTLGANIGFWTASSGQWTDPANWTSPSFPNGLDDAAYFESPGTNTITLSAPITLGALTFDASTYTLNASTSGSLTFASSTSQSSLLLTSGVTATTTLSLPITLNSSLLITNNGTSPLLFSGPLSGSGNLILNGKGEVDLRGTNSAWTPASITLNAGLLSTVSGAFTSLGDPTSGTITINGGASLDISGIVATSTTQQFTKSLILSGSGTPASPGAVSFGATTSTLLGSILLNGPTTFNAKAANALLHIGDPTGIPSAASLSGTGPLIKAGTGNLQINIPATFTGGTQVNAGSLIIGTTGSLVGTGNITLNNGGRLLLRTPAGPSPATNSISPNSILLSGGLLSIATDISLANMLSPASTSGIISIENATTFTAGGTNLIDLSTLPIGSAIRLGATSGTILSAGLTLIPDPSHTLHFTAFSGGFTLAAAINDTAGIPTNVEFGVGASQITLSGNSSYTGPTIINSNVSVNVTNANALGSPLAGTTINTSGVLTIGAATLEPLTVNGGTAHINAPTSGAILVKSGSMDITAAGGTSPVTITGGSLTISGAGVLLPILVSGGTVNLNGAGSGSITITAGTVNANSAITGLVTLSGGLLKQGAGGTFAAQSILLNGGRLSLINNIPLNVILNSGSTGGVIAIDMTNFTGGTANSVDFTLFVGGGSLSLGTTTTGSLGSGLVLKPDNVTHTLHFGGAGASGSLTINSVIADIAGTPTNVDVAAGSTVILPVVNSYTGVTTVNGTAQVNNALGLGAGTGIDANGTVVNAGGRVITGVGVTLTNEKITLNGGSLSLNSAGPVMVTAPSFLNGNYSGPISGGGNFTITGNTSLSGSSSFTGGVTILSGASVTVSSPTGLGDISGGTTLNSGGSLTLSAASAESVTVAGGNFLVNGSYSGNTTVNAGAMTVNALSASSITLNAGSLTMNVAGSSSISQNGGVILLNDTSHVYTDVITSANAATISANPIVAGTVKVQNALLTSGTLSLFTASNATLTLTGGITGSGLLKFQPLGAINVQTALNFSGTVSTNGVTTISVVNTSGTLYLGGASVIIGSLHHVGDVIATANSLLLTGAPDQFDGTFANQSFMALFSNATFSHFYQSAGSLTGAGVMSVGDSTVDLRGGYFNFFGTILGATSITKSGTGPAYMQGVPLSFAGPINVQQGELVLSPFANGATNAIHVGSVNAFVTLTQGTFKSPIYLDNATGGNFASGGSSGGALVVNTDSVPGIAVLDATLDLGTVGSALSMPFHLVDSANLTVKGPISGGALTINAGLRLISTSSNTYTGVTTVYGYNLGGELDLRDHGSIASLAAINIARGGKLVLDNTGIIASGRIPAGTPVNLARGTIEFDGNGAPGASSIENLGSVTVAAGRNVITIIQNADDSGNPSAATQLTINNLIRNSGATIDFEQGYYGRLGGNFPNDPRLLINSQALTNFMGGAYVYAYQDFVQYTATGVVPDNFDNGDYFGGGETGWGTNTIARVGTPGVPGTVTLTASRVVGALKFYNALNLSNFTLNVVSGGLIGPAILGTSAGRLTAGGNGSSAELFIYAGGTISANITDNPGPDGLYAGVPGGPEDLDNGTVSLVISGGIHLTGTNTYTGTTYVNDAVLSLDAASAVTKGPVILNHSTYFIGNFTVHPGDLTFRDGSGTGGPGPTPTGVIDAASYHLESGSIGLKLAGSGPIFKTGNDYFFVGDLSDYTGIITVAGGELSIGKGTLTQTFIQSGSLTTSGVSIRGSLTIGATSALHSMFNNTDYAPSSLSFAPGAILFCDSGNLIVSGTIDAFTDSGDSSRHLDAIFNSYLEIQRSTHNAGNLSGGGILLIDPGATLTIAAANIAGSVNLNGSLRIRPTIGSPAANSVNTLTIAHTATANAWTGLLDLTNNNLIVAGGSDVPNQLKQGAHLGAWNATAGITSSTAQLAATTSTATALSYATGSQFTTNTGQTTFSGQPFNPTDTLIMYTLAGDANMDTSVTFADFLQLQNHYNQAGTDWQGGDFNYDGSTTFADFLLLQNNYNKTLTAANLLSEPSQLPMTNSQLPGSVPEPTTLLLLTLPLLLAHRRSTPP